MPESHYFESCTKSVTTSVLKTTKCRRNEDDIEFDGTEAPDHHAHRDELGIQWNDSHTENDSTEELSLLENHGTRAHLSPHPDNKIGTQDAVSKFRNFFMHHDSNQDNNGKFQRVEIDNRVVAVAIRDSFMSADVTGCGRLTERRHIERALSSFLLQHTALGRKLRGAMLSSLSNKPDECCGNSTENQHQKPLNPTAAEDKSDKGITYDEFERQTLSVVDDFSKKCFDLFQSEQNLKQ